MKRILYFSCVTIAILSIFYLFKTYALLETNAEAKITEDVGKWQIKLNGTDISKGLTEDFNITNFIYTDNNNTADGVLSPGRSGYFDIIIDPTGTDVSVRYDITININNTDYPSNIIFDVSNMSDSSIIKSQVNTYSGYISLNEIKQNKTENLRVNIKWNNDDQYNDSDSTMGTTKNQYINIPVTVNVSQYLGETITPYA
jgi:hypothetical protein